MTFQRYPTSTIILCKSEKLWFKILKIGKISIHTGRKKNYLFTDQLLNWDLFKNLFKQRREKDDKREKSNKK